MPQTQFIILLCVIFSIYANGSNFQSPSSRQLLQSDELDDIDISSTIAMDMDDDDDDDDDDDMDISSTVGMDLAMDVAMDEDMDISSTLAGMDIDDDDEDDDDMGDISSTIAMDIAMDIDDDDDDDMDISSTIAMDIAMDIAAGPGPGTVLTQEEVDAVIVVITDGDFAAFKASVIEMSGLSAAESEEYDAQITAIIIETISESVDRAGGVLENLSVVEIIESILEDVGDLIENKEVAQQPEAVTPAPKTPAPVIPVRVHQHTPAPVKVTPAPVTPAPVTTKVINHEGSLGKEGAEGDEQGTDLDRFMRENEEEEPEEVETETVTLRLSEKTMVNIWIALIVFMCFNGTMIWCYFKRNKGRGQAILYETGTSDERPSSMPLP